MNLAFIFLSFIQIMKLSFFKKSKDVSYAVFIDFVVLLYVFCAEATNFLKG